VSDLFTLTSRQIAQIWPRFFELISSHLATGTWQCQRLGIRDLYGIDILAAGDGEIEALDQQVASRYAQPFQWYQEAMRRCQMCALIRPVHPEFYLAQRDTPSSCQELAFTRTVMRIDPLLEFWQTDSPRRARLSTALGIEPVDAPSWRAFINALFDRAESCGAVGIKQLQAYSRDLAFLPRQDSEVRFRGELSPSEVHSFQDWVVQACSAQAHERHWPQQVHVGTHNLGESSPLPLLELARRYPQMNIILLHCWPYLDESGWLAKNVPNIFLDTCWLPILNPEYLRQALRGWLGYVPASKICCSHDATSIEMAAGSLHYLRHILGQELAVRQADLELTGHQVLAVASGYLNANAASLYGAKKEENQ